MKEDSKHTGRPRGGFRSAAGALAALAAVALACLSSSCEKIYEYEGDCDPHWRVRFEYAYNMEFADAFPGPMGVGSVRLDVFDAGTGALVLEKEAAAGPDGFAKDFVMPVEELKPGRYDFVAWCGLDGNDSFAGGDAAGGYDPARPAWSLSEKALSGTGEDRWLKPLYYGRADDVTVTDEEGEHTVTVSLMKDVNEFTVVLQHRRVPLNPEDFEVTITDDNGTLLWDNSLAEGTTPVAYRPWSTERGTVEPIVEPGVEPVEDNLLVWRLSTSRLVLGRGGEPKLTITDERTERKVFEFPVLQYLLMGKPYARDSHNMEHPMGNQEYLDREDTWRMHFILDEGQSDKGGWYSFDLHVLGWHTVVSETDLGEEH